MAYANCEYCKKEMTPGTPCDFTHIEFADGTVLKRDVSVWDSTDPETICNDCNSPAGSPHHFGCDCERCPACGNQMLGDMCHDGPVHLMAIPETKEA